MAYTKMNWFETWNRNSIIVNVWWVCVLSHIRQCSFALFFSFRKGKNLIKIILKQKKIFVQFECFVNTLTSHFKSLESDFKWQREQMKELTLDDFKHLFKIIVMSLFKRCSSRINDRGHELKLLSVHVPVCVLVCIFHCFSFVSVSILFETVFFFMFEVETKCGRMNVSRVIISWKMSAN